jgi:hypothetical protein
MAESISFSSKPGYRLEDFNTACPITGEPCPAQEQLVAQYVGNAGQEGVDPALSLRDKSILQFKLGEYQFRAKPTLYVDHTEGCPTRAAMNENVRRQAAVKGIRSIMRTIGLAK